MSPQKNLASRFFTTRELSALLHISIQTAWNWSSSGRGPLQPVRVAGRLLWPRDAVEAILVVRAGKQSSDTDIADTDTRPDAGFVGGDASGRE